MRRMKLLAAILGAGILVATGQAQEHHEFVEPVITEETMPNEKGEIDLRITGSVRGKDEHRHGELPQFQLFLGLSERVGLNASLPIAFQREDGETQFGAGDASLDLKLLAVEHSESAPAIVLGMEAEFPTGDEEKELSEGAYAVRPFVALLKDFGGLTLQGNFGWERQLNHEEEDQFDYNWALAIPAGRAGTHLLLEWNGDWSEHPEHAMAIGFKQELSEHAAFGVAAPFGLNDRADDWGVEGYMQFSF